MKPWPAFGYMGQHETALAELQAHYAKRNRVMPDNTIKMTLLPSGAEYIDNPLGAACGYRLDTLGCSIYVFPGVPIELYEMIPLAFPTLVQQAEPLVFATFGIAESHILINSETSTSQNMPSRNAGNWLTLYPAAYQHRVANAHLRKNWGVRL